VLKGTLNGNVTVSAGATVTTDPGGVGASPGVPIQTSVQTPNAGTVAIDLGSTTQAPPASYLFLGSQVTISAPAASSQSAPLVLTFALDASLNPDPSVIRVARNGSLIVDCKATHSNLPCASIPAAADGHGDLVITVYTMQASTWNFGVHVPYAFAGFLAIKNPPALNVWVGGVPLPLLFTLGGNQGLAVLARSNPTSQRIACDTLVSQGPVEPATTSNAGGLVFERYTGVYTYLWKTQTSWRNSCRRFSMKLMDGSTHVVFVKLK
jgi:hypothetical protein